MKVVIYRFIHFYSFIPSKLGEREVCPSLVDQNSSGANLGRKKKPDIQDIQLVLVLCSIYSYVRIDIITFEICLHLQQLAPAKQAKVMQEFQKQSAQMDMTVVFFDIILFLLVLS